MGGVMLVAFITALSTNINDEFLVYPALIALFIPYVISLFELMFLCGSDIPNSHGLLGPCTGAKSFAISLPVFFVNGFIYGYIIGSGIHMIKWIYSKIKKP
jgi:hypothetical protein